MTLRIRELERFATLALRLLVFMMMSIDAAEWPGREWDDCFGWDEEWDERLRNKREGRKCETVKCNRDLRYSFFFHNLIENELLFRCSIQIKKFTASLSCVFYRISSTRKGNYSLSCLSKPVCLTFLCRTQKEMFRRVFMLLFSSK